MRCSCRLLPIVASLLLLIPPYSHAQEQGSPCNTSDVRLVGGRTALEGRVEFCNNGTWGTVCNDGWDDNDAQVICRQLGEGYSAVGARSISGINAGRYEAGTGPIYLDEVRCRGNESALIECTTNGLGQHNCDHSEDAGVRCEAAGFSCNNGDLRLEGGNTSYDGRVEVCVSNKFTTVCDDGTWGQEEAEVVCRQLNFTDGVPIPIGGQTFGFGIGEIQLTGLRCTGSEDHLAACPSIPTFFSLFCSHFDDAGVLCPQPNPPCENGQIRLTNGRIPSEGRIEICFNGFWGTICHDGWDNREAQVVCREIGYPGNNSLAIGYGDFGSGEGFIHLSNIVCTGTEDRLFDCGGSPVGQHFCNHGEDAGVICEDPDNACTEGDMRLVGGDSPNEGRLEVCFFNHWGTVCDDEFGSVEAQLVCRELGFPEEGAIGLHVAFFGEGVGIIFVDDAECIGNETSILDCSHLGIGTSNCFHNEDVSVLCQSTNATCTNGEIRLVNGTGSHSGRVEVCFNGRWGTVCDDTFGVDDATVVCRQLGFPGEGAISLSRAYFGRGTGPIFLDDTNCLPENHTSLVECFESADSTTVGEHNCDHSEDVSVICPAGNQSCGEYPNGAVRLVDGPTPYEGRVELCLDGEWGTICDTFWTALDAVVICRQLSFGLSDATAVSDAQYGRGNGTIHLDRFFCSGDENYLTDCIHNRAPSNCQHSQDAGVVCSAKQCEEGELRLVGGSLPTEGRVEICIDGRFDTVCDDFWDARDAAVVCRQLGYSDQNAIALPSAFFGSGSRGIALDDVQCIGNESRLLDCDHLPDPTFCFHFEDAGVLCEPVNSSCTNGEIRLAGGSAPWEGNVEVCFSGRWGTVCHDRWDQIDAQTTCRILGFGNGSMAIATRRAFFGIRTDRPIFLDEVGCLGNETGILQCASVDVGNHNCFHFLDAGVICSVTNSSFECQTGDVRLVGGQDESEGRVEVCINGEWGTVCDDGWSTQDAQVVCQQLGFDSTGAEAFGNAAYGPGTGDIYLSNLACTGSERNLIECRGLGPAVPCFHSEDAGAKCRVRCADGEIRLFGGDEPTEGTVEVCRAGEWTGATVCDDLWDTPDATVVCRQLGFETNGAISVRGAFFGPGNGAIPYAGFGCLGNESHLLNCTYGTPFFCSHSEDAGVICPSSAPRNCTTGDVRLRGGNSAYEGRVEVCLHGYWGTICDDSWDSRDATVVCNQLGYNESGYAAAVRNGHFGAGDGRIVLDEVRCVGNETELLNCRAAEKGVHNCVPTEDAGVFCPSASLGCINGALRLVDGEEDDQGRVEVCLGGQWGTVCADNFWDNTDAQVVCRQLGYENPAGYSTTVGGGSGPILVSQLQCAGNEDRLVDCPGPQFTLTSSLCTHDLDAGVVCNISSSRCENGDIRLVGGAAKNLGRLEICFGNLWGSVCDDLFDSNEAQVVCRQLGYTDYQLSVVVRNGFFGQGQTAIHLDDLNCDGSERRLADCSHPGVGNHNCAHFEDVGVICHANEGTCDYGELRLVGGTSNREGRVEICIGGLWGTICDDSYDTLDATVICRELGFITTGAFATDTRTFGQGTGLILLDELGCTGNETRLIDCPSNEVGIHNCAHFEDIGVSCAACTDGNIRLVNNNDATAHEGTIEICAAGVWGTICDDSWDNRDAQVACRQLQFQPEGAISVRGAFFGPGSGDIQRTNFGCRGSEERLTNCNSTSPLFCTHSQDAGVICPPAVTPNCTTGALRLREGTNQYEGRVEICLNGRWGTICDDSWDSKDATVVCRELGYNTTGRAFGLRANTVFGPGNGFIALDEVNCEGTESTLLSCRASERGSHDCSPNEDAGALCPYEGAPCVSGETRLVNNGTINNDSGIVEICAGGRWSTVCAGTTFGNSEARVICRQLGHTNPENAISGVQGNLVLFGEPVLLKEPDCSGDEEHIFDCAVDSFPPPLCDFHLTDAAVFCNVPIDDCNEGDIRLVNGLLPNEGRVEICFNNQWGTICDDSWGAAEAQVVCRQLNYTTHLQDSVPFSDAYFGSGLTAIHLDDLNCTGTERKLADCSHSGVGIHNCLHFEDAGVLCIANNAVCEHGAVRLVGGNSSRGRVEICIGGRWGTVCNDQWDEDDATVVCTQLGFSPEGTIATNAIRLFGTGDGPIFLDELQCTGTEASLLDCPSDGLGRHDCNHFEDVAVICNRTQPVIPTPFCNEGDLRLFSGEAENEGTLELCLNEAWGTVCDDLWDNNDAKVACRKLGFQAEGAIAMRGGFFDQGTSNIHIANLRCTGNETSLLDCSHRTNPFCFHFEDAGVICPPRVPYNCTTGDVRLRDGNSPYEGRVEVCLHGRWGTVCDDSWDSNDATVVCRQLNYLTGEGIAYAVQRAAFGPGSGLIFLDEVRCNGNETTLLGCRASDAGNHNCLPTEDAGVICPNPAASCVNGAIRLVGGSDPFEGRVEICIGDAWGTLCQDVYWDDPDAQVICKQVGYTNPGEALAVGAVDRFGIGTGPIFLNGLNCSGNETRITDCQGLNPGGLPFCTHQHDAGVICSGSNISICTDGQARLVGSDFENEGRVEVCFNNHWGTVCDDDWDVREAQVICRQLNFNNGTGAVPVPRGFFGLGTGRIHFDDLGCNGTEQNLLTCSHRGAGIHNCGHNEDAGVICQVSNPRCEYGSLRLVGGSIALEGRVEICLGGRWGTVCDDQWDNTDASVVCKQLGYSANGAVATFTASFGRGEGPIFMDDTRCTGAETMLIQCPSSGIGSHNCLHFEDAGAICQPIPCSENSARLSGGLSEYSGRVEICVNQEWGEVCSDGFGTDAAVAVCRNLGLDVTPSNAIITQGRLFEQAVDAMRIYNITGACDTDGGTCNFTSIEEGREGQCSEASNKAGLFCQYRNATDICTTGAVRLMGGNSASEGRVEICLNNQWGTVCDDSWDNRGAAVVCRQLGYSYEGEAAGDSYGITTGPIFLDNIKCSGSEAHILGCPQLPLGTPHDCKHTEDVAIKCSAVTGCTNGDVRLVNGATGRGRVEICSENSWGTICNDDWDESEAVVVCRQLNFNDGQGAVVTPRGFFGSGSSEPQMNAGTLNCQRSEQTVDQCSQSGAGNGTCEQRNVAGVICQVRGSSTACRHGGIRLTGGSSLSGRVEICLAGQWGSVCADNWNSAEASVACRQLGFQAVGAVARQFSRGATDAPTLVRNTQCSGGETELFQCRSSGIGVGNCPPAQQAGVTCQSRCTEDSVRLVGGLNQFNGRIEICKEGSWAAVCKTGFGSDEASAVCSALGLKTSTVFTTLGQIFQQSTDQMQATYSLTAACSDGATCNFTSEVNSQCSETDKAGVFCPRNFSSSETKNCDSGVVRLTGGSRKSEGRLEVCLNNQWGTVCDDSWDDRATAVVCRQLGYQTKGAKMVRGDMYGQATGPIFLDDVKCRGAEENIFNCPQRQLSVPNNCQHSEDVGIQCVEQASTQEPPKDQTKEPTTSKQSSVDLVVVVIPLIVIIVLLILIIIVIVIIVLVYRARKVGKLSFREYDDTVPMAQSTSFNESLSKEAGAIQLEEKSDLAAL